MEFFVYFFAMVAGLSSLLLGLLNLSFELGLFPFVLINDPVKSGCLFFPLNSHSCLLGVSFLDEFHLLLNGVFL
jgi:hypothetical protein